MKHFHRFILLFLSFSLFSAVILSSGCTKRQNPDDKDGKEEKEEEKAAQEQSAFAKGADISWITEMEDAGYRFYDSSGTQKECTALLASIGMNAVRYRVWVNPEKKYNTAADVVAKALRAKSLGMRVMIDFHYSDSWADPGKQVMPSAWSNHTIDQLVEDVSAHTCEVLSALKNAGVDVSWVQVGNEVTNGFLWEKCRVSGSEASCFVRCFNAGYSAVKKIFPSAKVILHIDNGHDTQTLKWFYSLVTKCGAKYDVIGLSLYPSYWDSSLNGYPDWSSKVRGFVSNLSMLHSTYGKEIMLVEFGMPSSEPEKAREALQYIFDNTSGMDYFTGLFYWEPESERSRNGYDYGAFSGGSPTVALAPFGQNR